ncbi:MAG: YceI family protein [Leptospiraceae bacterium]|nr:YceI family protein [Leptospiraceae bacterium]
MKKLVLINLFISLIFPLGLSSIEIKEKQLKIKSGKIIFISEAPRENIKGIGKLISGRINVLEKKLSIEINLKDWRTSNKLQTSHLHENYLETDKFPNSIYEGKIESINSDGKVVTIGKLNLHGVTKENVKIERQIIKKENSYVYESNFIIKLSDYKIKIPKLLILKVNEEIKINTNFILEGE